jgi:hypothetical protein
MFDVVFLFSLLYLFFLVNPWMLMHLVDGWVRDEELMKLS